MPRAPPPPAFDRRFILEPDARLQSQDVASDLLSVASFNMLADALHLAGQPRQQFDRWEHRWPVLEAQLETLTADIVCLQEVDEKTFYKHLIPFFTARGYAGELQDGGRRRWGNATFWVRHKFAKCVVDNRSRILVTKLRYVWGRQNVFVVNVHLQAAPWAELERVQQLSKALRRCETRHGCRLPRDHIIVAGDFNSSFKSKTAQFTMGTSSFRASELMSQDDGAAADRGSAGGGTRNRRGNGRSQARRKKGRQEEELGRDPADVAYQHAYRLAHAASTVDRML